MTFTGRTQPVSQHGVVGALRVLKELGFDGAEICVETKEWDVLDFTPDLVADVSEALAELDFAAVSFSRHADYIYDDEALDDSIKLLALTPRFGTDLFIVSGCRRRESGANIGSVEWKRMVDRTRRLIGAAEEHGVLLAMEHEPLFIVGTTEEQIALKDELGSSNFVANLDLGHSFVCDPDVYAAIERLGPMIRHCHIENMPPGLHKHLLPDDPDGGMDLPRILRALRDVGFTGPLALDLYVDDYEAAARRALPYLRSIDPDGQ